MTHPPFPLFRSVPMNGVVDHYDTEKDKGQKRSRQVTWQTLAPTPHNLGIAPTPVFFEFIFIVISYQKKRFM